jgi:transposase
VKVSPMNDFTLFLPDAAKLILQQVVIDPETHQVVLTIATSQRDCACPKCQAVSHRVHSHYPRQIADLPWSDYNVQLPPIATMPVVPSSPPKSPPPSVYVQQRQAQHQTVRDLYYQQNWSSEAIAQHLGISQRTVQRDLNRPNYIPPPNRKPRRVRSSLAEHQDFIVQYYQSAERSQTGLLKALRDRGYMGCERTLSRYLKELLQQGQIARRLGSKDVLTQGLPQPANLLTPREMAWLIMQPQSQQTHETQILLQQLKTQSAELASMIEFATEFLDMIRQRQSQLFEPWLERFEQSPISLIQSFTAGLRDDFEAVKAAMQTEVSNGPVEGLNNRLKMLKRQMYGRANVDLLEKRFILTSQDYEAA